jgi:amidase
LLDAIVGFDPRDYEATKAAAKFIPAGGYTQFLNVDGLKGKRLGVVRNPFLDSYNGSTAILAAFEHHLNVLRYLDSVAYIVMILMKNQKFLNKSSYFLLFSFLGISRQRGATILDNLEIADIDTIMNPSQSGELIATLAEFKLSINNYLEDLINSNG